MIYPNRDPGIAAVLSAMCSGFGQMYNGEIGKGLGFLILQLINLALTTVLIGFVTLALTYVYSIYDAKTVAENSQVSA